MYRIDENLDLNFVQRKDLLQISVGVSQIQFKFSEDIMIGATCRITMKYKGRLIHTITNELKGSVDPLRLVLNETVEEVTRIDETELSILFTNGYSIHLHDDSDWYESFEIWNANEVIII